MPPLERWPSAAASVESKMATMQHKIFCVREFIKTESATAVQRAFRLRFNIQPPNEEEHLSLESPVWANRAVCVKAKAPADHVYQRRRWDEFKRVLSVAHASQPVERAGNLEYRNQLSGVCWGAVYCSSHKDLRSESTCLNHAVYLNLRKRNTAWRTREIFRC